MPTITIETIRQQLHARLLESRAETASLEKALKALNGTAVPHREPREPQPKPTKKTRRARTMSPRAPRPAGRRVLREYIKEAVQNEPDGLTLQDLTARILANGYHTTSQNFADVVGQELSGKAKHLYQRDSLNRWTMRENA